jgi:hypothetical protein
MTYYISPPVTDWQRQIILGTVLGGSSIVRPSGGKNSYLSMRGSNAYWLEYKSYELKELASPNPFLIEKENRYFRWHSLCYPVFNEFHTLFYRDRKKRVEMSVLNELRDIGLAVWFVDGGRYERRHVVLNTTSFGWEGSETICGFFNEITLPASIKQKGNSFRVQLEPNASIKFLKTIAHRVPQFMHHHLESKP